MTDVLVKPDASIQSFRVEVSVRNNRLQERREELGLSRIALAKSCGVSGDAYGKLESMKASPLTKKGTWRQPVLKLAELFGVDPSELFPREILTAGEQKMTSFKLGKEDVHELVSGASLQMSEGAEASDFMKMDGIYEAMDSLCEKHRMCWRIVCWRYGLTQELDGSDRYQATESLTLDEIGKKYNLSRERVRQLSEQGLAHIRRHIGSSRPKLTRGEELEEFVEKMDEHAARHERRAEEYSGPNPYYRNPAEAQKSKSAAVACKTAARSSRNRLRELQVKGWAK